MSKITCNRCRELARLATAEHGRTHKVDEPRTGTILDLFERTDVFRRPERFEHPLVACETDFSGRCGYAECPYPQADVWRRLLETATARLDAIQG